MDVCVCVCAVIIAYHNNISSISWVFLQKSQLMLSTLIVHYAHI